MCTNVCFIAWLLFVTSYSKCFIEQEVDDRGRIQKHLKSKQNKENTAHRFLTFTEGVLIVDLLHELAWAKKMLRNVS